MNNQRDIQHKKETALFRIQKATDGIEILNQELLNQVKNLEELKNKIDLNGLTELKERSSLLLFNLGQVWETINKMIIDDIETNNKG